MLNSFSSVVMPFKTVQNPSGYGTDCDDNDFTRYPNAPELCDGAANEWACRCQPMRLITIWMACGVCNDVNGWWGSPVVGGDDCDDGNAAVNP